MMKIITILQTAYLTILVVVLITFSGCKECPCPLSPAEIKLTSIDTLSANQIQYTFSWSEVTEAESYQFILEVNGQIEHTETTGNSEFKRILQLDFGDELKFKVQSNCEDGTKSQPVEDTIILPEPCKAPQELGLISIDNYRTQFTYGWSIVPNAEAYEFTLEVDGEIQLSETTSENKIEITNIVLNDSIKVKASIRTICEAGAKSEAVEDVFTFQFTIAAVEEVYRLANQIPDVSEICSTQCEFVKFGVNSTGTFCEADITYFPHYYFAKEDFCDCAVKDCETNSFVDCLKTKDKLLYRSDDMYCSEPPVQCTPPTELGLISVDNSRTQFIYGWTNEPNAQEYEFTIEVDGELLQTETTSNNEIEINLEFNYYPNGNIVKAKVSTICEAGAKSETVEDVFTFQFTIAAVEEVYRLANQIPDVSEICNSSCDFVKFGANSTGTFCEANITYLPHYYFAKEDFCDCATNDCETNSFTDCLKTKNKLLYGSDRENCP